MCYDRKVNIFSVCTQCLKKMKFNDRELAVKGAGPVDFEGILHHLRPQNNDWANWYSQPSYKERKFKLVANLLFYYRIGESEPLGVFVLENFTVQHERSFHGAAFPFSIIFGDEPQRKHIFSCRCQEEVDLWLSKLKNSSYEHWRTELAILQKKISMRTGQDPMTSYSRNQCEAERLEWSKPKSVGPNKSSFRCHLETTVISTTSDFEHSHIKPTEVPNLIEF